MPYYVATVERLFEVSRDQSILLQKVRKQGTLKILTLRCVNDKV